MNSLNLPIPVAASQCPPPAAAPAVAQTLTLAEVMYRSPKRNFTAGEKRSKYRASAAVAIRRSAPGCSTMHLPNRRSPSPSLAPFDLFAAADSNSPHKRLRSFRHTSSSVAKLSHLSRSITPVKSGRRSETPLSASNRINQHSSAASPLPCAPLPPRLPTARVLFGQAPTIAETQDFFMQVEHQLREDFAGNRRIGTPQPASVLNPDPSASHDDTLWDSEA
ncbi:hypothetical protein NADE_000562 [Nannochloris sp. 'desiccata']|nr:hypothetical protein KSW81_004676 [Chlorella desiccata (nom. nud.)]KAH7618368.1 hypothetical protein NADE_000562 [Chlorella desiccata (nom. nud.)]